VTSALNQRIRRWRANPTVRRVLLAILGLIVVKNVALVTIALWGEPTRRAHIVVALVWIVGAAVLLWLVRAARYSAPRQA